jgi:hypothetical protein
MWSPDLCVALLRKQKRNKSFHLLRFLFVPIFLFA